VSELPAKASDIYSIIVAGAMNPRIHHPQWYRSVGAIDQEELASALAESVVVTPAASQFRIGMRKIGILSNTEQWAIQSDSAESWNRMMQITSTVFSRLNDTPVGLFAFNVHRHLETVSSNVKSVLGNIIQQMQIGLPGGVSLGNNIMNQVSVEDFRVTTVLQPSVNGERLLFVGYTSEHNTPSDRAAGHFDLGQLMVARLPNYLVSLEKSLRDILEAFNRRAVA
jgi:hypothetical protein